MKKVPMTEENAEIWKHAKYYRIKKKPFSNFFFLYTVINLCFPNNVNFQIV